jgi:hypothetical protein
VLWSSDSNLSVAMMIGSADQPMYSLYRLVRHSMETGKGDQAIDEPLTTAIGQFLGPDAPLDVAVLSADGPFGGGQAQTNEPFYRLWPIECTGEGKLNESPSAGGPLPDGIEYRSAMIAAVDLDPAPAGSIGAADELVVLASGEDGFGKLITARLAEGLGGSKVWEASLALGDIEERFYDSRTFGGGLPPGENLSLEDAYPLTNSVAVADIDGDGDLDFAALGAIYDSAAEENIVQLVVFWNDGQDTFSLSRLGPLTSTELAGRNVTSFAFLQADTDPSREIAIVTANGAYLADVEEGIDRPLAVRASLGDKGGLAVAAGDISGDGLDDIVISRGIGIHLYVAQPVNP